MDGTSGEMSGQTAARYNDQMAMQCITQAQDLHMQRMNFWAQQNQQAAAFAAKYVFCCPNCGYEQPHNCNR